MWPLVIGHTTHAHTSLHQSSQNQHIALTTKPESRIDCLAAQPPTSAASKATSKHSHQQARPLTCQRCPRPGALLPAPEEPVPAARLQHPLLFRLPLEALPRRRRRQHLSLPAAPPMSAFLLIITPLSAFLLAPHSRRLALAPLSSSCWRQWELGSVGRWRPLLAFHNHLHSHRCYRHWVSWHAVLHGNNYVHNNY